MVKLIVANNSAHSPTTPCPKQNKKARRKRKTTQVLNTKIFSAKLSRAAAITLINVRFRISC